MPDARSPRGRRGRSRGCRRRATSIAHGPIGQQRHAPRRRAKPAIASTVDADRRAPRPSSPPPARWGSSEVWIDWKSCSGARVISSALKTTPARAAVGRAADGEHRGVEQRLLGELDRRRPRARSRRPRAACSALARRSARPAPLRRGASAHGITSSDATGAAAMPERDRGLPVAMPTATASGKQNRETDSNSTSPP